MTRVRKKEANRISKVHTHVAVPVDLFGVLVQYLRRRPWEDVNDGLVRFMRCGPGTPIEDKHAEVDAEIAAAPDTVPEATEGEPPGCHNIQTRTRLLADSKPPAPD